MDRKETRFVGWTAWISLEGQASIGRKLPQHATQGGKVFSAAIVAPYVVVVGAAAVTGAVDCGLGGSRRA